MRKEFGRRRLAQMAMTVGLAAMLPVAASAQTATHTTLTAETRDTAGKTVATFTTQVVDAENASATGVVTLVDHGKAVSSAALNSEGKAEIQYDSMTTGDHSFSAVYNGDADHLASTSESVAVHPMASPAPDFGLAINPTSLSIKVGASGTTQATITPENGFTGFISLSCAGPTGATTLPTGITCTYAPANLQVSAPTTANPSGAVSAQLSIQTSLGQGFNQAPQPLGPAQPPMVLAILLPGVIGLGFLGRKRKKLGRFALLLLLSGVALAGTTGCNPRYYYLNHGPTFGGAAPGTYTLQVIAQTSNGVTASSHVVDLAITVTD